MATCKLPVNISFNTLNECIELLQNIKEDRGFYMRQWSERNKNKIINSEISKLSSQIVCLEYLELENQIIFDLLSTNFPDNILSFSEANTLLQLKRREVI